MADRPNGDTRAHDASKVSDTAISEKADNAANLSSSLWAPEKGDTGSRDSKTTSSGAVGGLNDGFGIIGDAAEAKKEAVSKPEIFDKGEKSDDPRHPSNWKTDKFGNVTEAGPEFKAQYNDKGELQSVTQGNETWRVSAPGQIEHTWTDSKGATNSDVLKGVTSFSAKPYFSDRGGGLLGGMTVEIGRGISSSAYSKPIYRDAAFNKYADSVLQGLVQGSQRDKN